MKIAVIAAHYLPEMGYVEVQLSRALSAEGHEVRVITTSHVPPRGRDKGLQNYSEGIREEDGVEVQRLPYRFAFQQVVIPEGLRKAVETYDPGSVIAIGIGKLFPGPVLLSPSERDFRLIALFGNNRFNYRKPPLTSLQKRLVQRILKDPLYDRAVRNCDHLWCYTPETEALLSQFTQGKREEELRKKVKNTSLGFDPDRFYYDETERQEGREKLGVDTGEVLFITATRLVPSKGLERVIEAFERVIEEHPELRYLLIGSTGSPYARSLKERMERSSKREHFHLLPFQRVEELRYSFNSADIGLWTAASITVQQGMGTGLPILVPESPALSRLLQEPKSGVYYRKEGLEEGIRRALKTFGEEGKGEREQRMKANRERFSDRSIARDLVERSLRSC